MHFIKKTVTEAGFKKVILGISGGIDSATVLYLSQNALGGGNVIAVSMPYGKLDPDSLKFGRILIDRLKIKNYCIDIAPMVDAYFKNFPDADNMRRGNLMARQRMAVLYDLSKKESALVIGSGNKTEILLGYCTLFGDTACALNPLAHLYKTQVFMLAAHLGVPDEIIKRKPTAGLWDGQTDEDELGYRYRDIDKLLSLMVDKKFSDDKLIKAGFEKEFIDNIKIRIKNYAFKRGQVVIPGE